MDPTKADPSPLLSEEEIDALSLLGKAADASAGDELGQFEEDLKSVRRADPESGDSRAVAPEVPDDAELRLIARFAPTSDASLLRNCIELPCLFGILVGIEIAVTGRFGGYRVHPHPYWLLVLPMAASRGILGGVLAAGLASILFASGAYRTLQLTRVGDLLTYEIMQEPLLFGFAAFFVGQFRDEIAVRYRALWRRFMHLQDVAEQIFEYNQVLTEANHRSKIRLLDHSVQFGNLIGLARRQDKASVRQVLDVTLDMIEEHCSASMSSVLLPSTTETGVQFTVAAYRGWDERFIRQSLQERSESEIVQTAVAHGIRINGLDPDSVPPGLGPLMVAPLFDDSLAVCAVLCLDQLPSDRLSSSTASIFFGIADWVEAGLRQVSGMKLATYQAPSDGPANQPWLGWPEDLGYQIFIEDARCTRMGLVSSLLGVQATSSMGVSTDSYEALDQHIFTTLGVHIRNTDTIFRFGYPGCYAIVLAGTGAEGAAIVADRITDWLGRTRGHGIDEFSVKPYCQSDDVPNLGELIRVMATDFRAGNSIPMDRRCPVRVPDRGRLGDPRDFMRTMRLEMGLALRHGFDLFVIRLTIGFSDSLDLRVLPGHVEKFAESLRATDRAFQLANGRFAVVLPGASTSVAFTSSIALEDALRPHLPERAKQSLCGEVFAAHGASAELNQLLARMMADESAAGFGSEDWD